MNQQITKPGNNPIEAIERLIIYGDLSRLTPEQKVTYYRHKCEHAGLDWTDQPLDYIQLQGKLTLYCKKNGTDQLRRVHSISIKITDRNHTGDLVIVTACAKNPEGREDESTGAVSVQGLKGEALANEGISHAQPAPVPFAPAQKNVNYVVPPITQNQPQLVTMDQLRRLHTIQSKSEWKPEDVKEYISQTFGYSTSKDLNRDEYDQVVSEIQKGPPMKQVLKEFDATPINLPLQPVGPGGMPIAFPEPGSDFEEDVDFKGAP
jgi:hypothetical protein